jgi:alkanesulfonate monooxygenase SsuD/methylene tetrahydromethanopterin reductase-like flavin-dependent oxidoreductase (luciferase family)
MASDHFHPWTPDQGQSAFVWSWMGALGATTNLRFGTGVTPPGFRYHPAIIAQAAATLEAMYLAASGSAWARVRPSTST